MNRKIDRPIASLSILRSRRSWVVLSFLIVAAIVAAMLYCRPTHSYAISGNSEVWSADVKIALAESGSGGTFAPTGALRNLPGVGKIQEVVVDKATLRKAITVLFLIGIDKSYGGLAYLEGYPPPPDSCSVHLTGPWWQVTHINDSTMGCPRGFSFTGGG